MPSQDEIYQKVSATLVEALNVDEDEIKPTATLQGDLGAESIDFLDIVFKLEKAFSVEIPRKDLSPEDILTNATYVQDGKVTPAGIAELKKRMPFADFTKFEASPQIRDFSNLITVSALCKYIETKVGA